MSNVITFIINTNFVINIYLLCLYRNYKKMMASINLKKLPDDLHREIKRLQLDMEDKNIKKSLEDIYIELIQKGLNQVKKETPTK